MPISADLLMRAFVHRADVCAIQKKDGSGYTARRLPITEQNLEDHLKGRYTIGLYQLETDNTVKWAVIDLDVIKEICEKEDFDFESWRPKILEMVKLITDKFLEYGIKLYPEDSGRRGYHLWMLFSEPISAQIIKDSIYEILGEVELPYAKEVLLDIFPQQSSISGENGTLKNLGSLVKAPNGINRKSGKWSKLIDFPDQFSQIEFVKPDIFNTIISPIEAIFKGCKVLRELRKQGFTSGHLNHKERLVLEYLLLNCSEGGEKELRRVLERLDDYSEKETNKYIHHAKSRKYKPIRCESLQDPGYALCPGRCENIGNSNSPIVFYYRKCGMTAEEEILNAYSRFDDIVQIGHCYYIRDRNNSLQQISNFVINADFEKLISDGIETKKIIEGNMITERGNFPFSMTAEEWARLDKFARSVHNTAGFSLLFSKPELVRAAASKYMEGSCQYMTIYRTFGFDEAKNKYLSPSVSVTKDKISENEEITVDLTGEDKAEFLDLRIPDPNHIDSLKKHIKEDLLQLTDKEISLACFAHAFVPIIYPFVEGDKTKYILFLAGSSGSGKSFLASALQNFYGNFKEPVSWTSTPKSLSRIGYFFNDALYLIDDFKKRSMRPSAYNEALSLIQNYTDGTGRSRMKSDSTLNKTYFIRGHLLITGEDTISGETSGLARTITLKFPSKTKSVVKGFNVGKYKAWYPEFTALFIKYVLNNKQIINKTLEKYIVHFHDLVKNRPNDIRAARNVALLLTSAHLVFGFLWNKEEAEEKERTLKNFFEKYIDEMLIEIEEESPSHRMWNTLHELIATQKLRLQVDREIDVTERGDVVGYYYKGEVFLIPQQVILGVQKYLRQAGEEIMHSQRAIFQELFEKGYIDSPKTYVKSLNGQGVRVVRMVKNDNSKSIREVCGGTTSESVQ